MAYSQVTDVQLHFKGTVFSSTTAVTEDAVASFIEEADAEIDSRIGLVYETPVTAAASLILLRKISVLLVKAVIRDILAVKTSVEKVNQDANSPDPAKEARALLDKIVDRKIPLPGATELSSNGGISSFATSLTSPHVFRKDEDQW